jgi:sensor domain CHASE-containing protein/nitrogen-specific signal transduction histidine kinase
LLSVFVLYGIIDYAAQRFVIFPGFLDLECEEAQKDLKRCMQAIKREIHHLDSFCHDWSAWDDTYEFAESRSENFIKSNLQLGTFTDNELNLIYFCDTKGEVIWGQIIDLETEEPMEITDFSKVALPQTHPLISFNVGETALKDLTVAGVFMTGQGPMFIASRPILNSYNKGPIRGSVIMGRFFNNDLVETLIQQTSVDFEAFAIQSDSMPEAMKSIANQLTPEVSYHIQTHDDQLNIYAKFADLSGDPILLLKAMIPRKIASKGSATIRYALISILSAGVAVLAVMLLLLQRTVLKPITRLTEHALSIGKRGDFSARLSLDRNDEIGTLATEFDRMMEQLSEARKQLSEQSYRSGMSEMASGILHNVRNSLNPAVGRIQLLRSKLREAPIKEIEMAQKELGKGSASEGRRENLVKFSLLANENLIDLLKHTSNKLEEIVEQMTKIEKILDDHHKWTFSERSAEQIKIEKLVDDSMNLLKNDHREAISVKIDPGMEAVGAIEAHRMSLLQVIGSLLTNAAESIQRKGVAHGEVHVRAETDTKDDKDMIHIEISDNGKGIDRNHLDRIFERDFSTKKDGVSGIGLHWCANTIAAMHGRIYAESEGQGKGASFHLVLPRSPETSK